MENARNYGAIPFFSWSSSATPEASHQHYFRLANIINGRFDPYIREFAEEAREWGHPFFLRFDWEMNGFWFPWSEGVNGNKAGEYVAAWRHVHRHLHLGRRHQRDLGLVPERRLHPQADPAQQGLPGIGIRRLDLPRRLQLGQAHRLGRLAELQPGLSRNLQAGAEDRPPQAVGDRRGRLERDRRLQAQLDRQHAEADSRPVPQDPRLDLVRRQGPQHPLAAGELSPGRQRLCQRHTTQRLPTE